MVTGCVIDYAHQSKSFHLPAEHAAYLTARQEQITLLCRSIYSGFGRSRRRHYQRFKNGSGVPYSKVHRFHEVMAEDSSQSIYLSLKVTYFLWFLI
jgi:hypothetical protein